MITYPTFKNNVLRFLERCGVSDGVSDEAAWEAAGLPSVFGAAAERLVKPAARRRENEVSLEARMRTDAWAFASTPGGVESLEGGHSAIETLFLLGELDRLSAANRRAWVGYFNQYQDAETGYYLGPYVPPRNHPSWRDGRVCTHPWSHMHDHLVSCLCPTLMLLGGTPRYPLSQGSMTGRFLDRPYLQNYLQGRDWNDYRGDLDFRRHNPWWMGNEFWFPAALLWQIAAWEEGSAAAREARKLLDEVWYPWHDANFASCGTWIGDLDGDTSLWWHGNLFSGTQVNSWNTRNERNWAAMPLMGGAHQLWFYNFENHPIPESVRRAQTDVILALQNPHNHHFGLGDTENPEEYSSNCTDVDCMTLLAMNYHKQNYRRKEIERALHDAARAILGDRLNSQGALESVPDQPFMHNFNSVPTFSPANWGNVLNQSFYLWAVRSAATVVQESEDPNLADILNHPWPDVPSHWLWVRRLSSSTTAKN